MQIPEWIWGTSPHDEETRYFRKVFDAPDGVTRVILTVSADNQAEVKMDGKVAAKNDDFSHPSRGIVRSKLVPGRHTLEVTAKNDSGPAGLLVELKLLRDDAPAFLVVSDTSWETSADGTTGWVAAKSLGAYGIQPWGNVLKAPEATPANQIEVAEGFKVELLRSAAPEEGSWVSMTIDPKGRLIVSPQGNEPILRITLTESGQVASVEPIKVPITSAMGLLCAYNALYVNGRGPEGYHLYRVTDTNGDDQYDHVELLHRWKSSGNDGGDGEHGAHGIVLGPDGLLYTVCGNFVDIPENLSPLSPMKNYADDHVLRRMEDGNGFGAGRKPPGGFVLRLDKDGKEPTLLAAGQRNTYDIAFNPDGELFGFDSDMEWDWGTPWYRPIRIYHIVDGGDQGFREGSGKWPTYYQDSLPPVVNVGIGSPTGVKFGTGARFPSKYQQALFAMDWSYGRIVAVHLTPDGASYSGTFETFVKGKPLNVTDMEIGPDGALYFTTGGRGTQAGLYRVSHPGTADTELTPKKSFAGADARKIRHELETYHGRVAMGAVNKAWKYLASSDRHLRYAARLAIESQPVLEWRDRALAETNPLPAITAFLALARVGTDSDQAAMLKALGQWPLKSLPEELQLLKLRTIEVSFSRHGIPEDLRAMAIERLSRSYPSTSWPLNRELSQILAALDAPDVVTKTLALRDQAVTQEEQLHYQSALRTVRYHWTTEERKRYFAWFHQRPSERDGGATYPAGGNYLISSANHPADFVQWFKDVGLEAGNGASYGNFLSNLRKQVVANMSDDERGELAPWITGDVFKHAVAQAKAPVPIRHLVSEWKSEDLAPLLDQVGSGRDFARGKTAYHEAQCVICHQFNGEGGAVGPDLTGLSSRYKRTDILDSMIHPSAVISEQYQATSFTLKNGDEVTGRLLEDATDHYLVLTDPINGVKKELTKSEVTGRVASKVSPMPEGLLNILEKDEILDLMAYLESTGKADAPLFKR